MACARVGQRTPPISESGRAALSSSSAATLGGRAHGSHGAAGRSGRRRQPLPRSAAGAATRQRSPALAERPGPREQASLVRDTECARHARRWRNSSRSHRTRSCTGARRKTLRSARSPLARISGSSAHEQQLATCIALSRVRVRLTAGAHLQQQRREQQLVQAARARQQLHVHRAEHLLHSRVHVPHLHRAAACARACSAAAGLSCPVLIVTDARASLLPWAC